MFSIFFFALQVPVQNSTGVGAEGMYVGLQTDYRKLLMPYLGEGRQNEMGPKYLANAKIKFFAIISNFVHVLLVYLYFKGDEIKVAA